MCECYQIGGPFIAEDPECPAHGTEAQAERRRREAKEMEQEERIAELERVVGQLMRPRCSE